jgi:hypothetical protein
MRRVLNRSSNASFSILALKPRDQDADAGSFRQSSKLIRVVPPDASGTALEA